jgi:uncharacterized protein (TIGR02996 family)
MNDEQALLTKFLAEPQSPAACLAYAAWLDERRDPRGEYLRLLAGPEESNDASADGRFRRLFHLRRKIDSVWADQVDRTRIATGGVYQSDPIDGAWHYLRFYPDGSVLSVRSTQTPAQAWQRFDQARDDRTFGRGVYKLVGGELRLSLLQEPPDSMRNAWKVLYDKRLEEDIARDFDFIAADAAIRQHATELAEQMKHIDYAGAPGRRSLCLNWHRLLDDSRGTMTYLFVEVNP